MTKHPLLIGHRGCGQDKKYADDTHPKENTVKSFLEAIKYVDGVELDIIYSKDGQLVINHDFKFTANDTIYFIHTLNRD